MNKNSQKNVQKTLNVENILENCLFTYNSYQCEAKVNIEYEDINEDPRKTLRIGSISDKPIKFAFEPQMGLIRLVSQNIVEEKNILGRLLSIKKDRLDDYLKFFKTNGFLFPTTLNKFESVRSDNFYNIIDNLNNLLDLLELITEPSKKDYDKILNLVILLLFHNDVCIKYGDLQYDSCLHSFTSLINNFKSKYDFYSDRTIKVNDSIYGESIFKTRNLKEMCSGYGTLPGDNDEIIRSVYELYAFEHQISAKDKIVLDFFYNYFSRVQKFNIYTYTEYETKKSDNFDEKLKQALIEVAKIIVKEEIDHNIKDIKPVYDNDKLIPHWSIPTLLQAMYFSIFYMKPNLQIYKVCENPNCQKHFLVNRTSSNKKKYCCDECRNKANQAKYRAKHSNKKTPTI